MKKIIFILLLSLTTIQLPAPGLNEIPIAEPEVIYEFDPTLHSFKFIESSLRTDIVNRLGYTGILQIGPEMVAEANRICDKLEIPLHFTMADALSEKKSTQMWYIVQNYWNPDYNLKRACHIWNPLASTNYYNKIKKFKKSLDGARTFL